tara:strand:+ start:482 stop:622 length:141 start_codon:yes stop_codon:yes gene_type:complete
MTLIISPDFVGWEKKATQDHPARIIEIKTKEIKAEYIALINVLIIR